MNILRCSVALLELDAVQTVVPIGEERRDRHISDLRVGGSGGEINHECLVHGNLFRCWWFVGSSHGEPRSHQQHACHQRDEATQAAPAQTDQHFSFTVRHDFSASANNPAKAGCLSLFVFERKLIALVHYLENRIGISLERDILSYFLPASMDDDLVTAGRKRL